MRYVLFVCPVLWDLIVTIDSKSSTCYISLSVGTTRTDAVIVYKLASLLQTALLRGHKHGCMICLSVLHS